MRTKNYKKSINSIGKHDNRRHFRNETVKSMATKDNAIQKSINKILAMLLIIGLNWTALSAISGTRAYFNDTETSENNSFGAAKLDFSLSFLMSDGFRTQTQGGWGAKANGNNPAVYRDSNFNLAFPDGLVIGDTRHDVKHISDPSDLYFYAHFSSSGAIKDFLPAGGTAKPFSGSHENPTDTEAGVLAGQIAALALNVGFDDFDPDFSVNESKLGDFYANEEPSLCKDMTVSEVLAEANLVLSGQPAEFSPAEINECAAEINEKFDDGKTKKITPTKSVWREIGIIKNGGLNFQHGIKIEEESGDADFCRELTADAYLNGTLLYSGNLLDFTYSPSVFSDSANKWKIDISLPDDAPSWLSDKICGFKYIVSGWQENIATEAEGFSDVEEISDSVESGKWSSGIAEKAPGLEFVVMNEFLPNPEGEEYGFDFGTDDSDMPRGEWIELYNNGETGYDLTGWYFKDLAGNMIKIKSTNSLPASLIIPPKDWLVVYMNKATLNNTGSETITLYDNYGNIADSYSYSGNDYCDLKPTKGNTNDQTPSGFCSGVPGNKSYARNIDGTGAWVDPIPTPGRSNITLENLIMAGLNNNANANVSPAESQNSTSETLIISPQEAGNTATGGTNETISASTETDNGGATQNTENTASGDVPETLNTNADNAGIEANNNTAIDTAKNTAGSENPDTTDTTNTSADNSDISPDKGTATENAESIIEGNIQETADVNSNITDAGTDNGIVAGNTGTNNSDSAAGEATETNSNVSSDSSQNNIDAADANNAASDANTPDNPVPAVPDSGNNAGNTDSKDIPVVTPKDTIGGNDNPGIAAGDLSI